jgi:ABC-type molybdate transport system substrate-binding protein
MKRFIFITVLLMVVGILIGCSGMTAEQRKETYDLRATVGNRPFVGEYSPEAQRAALGIGMY